MTSLSRRGQKAAQTALRIDLEIYAEASQNEYDSKSNPDGTLPLNIAENCLNWHMLRDRFEQLTRDHSIPDWAASYTSMLGAPPLRDAAAGFLERFLTKCPIEPGRIAFSAGATSIVEMSSFLLANPGDVAVFPTPCYPVYRQDIGNLPEVERYDLVTHHELSEISEGPILSRRHLDRALADIQGQGRTFRMLVLTNPDNPTGGIYSARQLADVADWCIDHRIYLIVNEIYGLSLINTGHPAISGDYCDPTMFTSFASIVQERDSDFLHLWYAFSKDFGISGFRVGLVYSHNTQFITAYENSNLGHTVSGYTQWIMQLLIEDDDFIGSYIERNQALLTESYAEVVTELRRLDIPYVPAGGSLFVWLDLSEFLEDATAEAENRLWLELYHTTGILLTPGHGFGHSKRGQFRLVHTSVRQDALEEAMRRLNRFVSGKRQDTR